MRSKLWGGRDGNPGEQGRGGGEEEENGRRERKKGREVGQGWEAGQIGENCATMLHISQSILDQTEKADERMEEAGNVRYGERKVWIPCPCPEGFFCRTTNENTKILARFMELFPNDYIYKNVNKSTSVHANLVVDHFHNGGLYILLNG